jgi:hypothetical protein
MVVPFVWGHRQRGVDLVVLGAINYNVCTHVNRGYYLTKLRLVEKSARKDINLYYCGIKYKTGDLVGCRRFGRRVYQSGLSAVASKLV